MRNIGQYLNVFNLEINKAGPDQHVPQTELVIRTLKGRVRCWVAEVPYFHSSNVIEACLCVLRYET